MLDRILSPEGWPYASSPPVDAQDPGRFNTLFGRDSLITALQLLPERPDVARATLRALAALQGRALDPETEEEPGKIVHEYWRAAPPRMLERGWPVRDGELRYYGSADSTPWFLVVLAASGDPALAGELEAAWRGAAAWLEGALERGGGLVRYGPGAPRCLSQQGWRDAIDPLDPAGKGGGILREDGRAPEPPLADADTQAVALVALRALESLEPGRAGAGEAARALARRIEDAFLPDVVALEGDDRPVRGAGSQLGWLLWAGALSADGARVAAERLTRPDVLTGYGLRTLAEGHPRFEPRAYHRGTVWPFDSWLGWGGLRAAGFEGEAERVRTGVLTALERLGGAPELYAVGPAGPELVGIANRVQAWSVGAEWALRNGWDARVI